jgi:acetyl-CoA synthetase
MRNIHKRYIDETYDAEGHLTKFQANPTPDFNFAYDIVDDIAIAEPGRPALTWANPEGEEHFFSFGDIKRWSDKCANFLEAQGIGKGDKVLVILRRHYQFWIVIPALMKLGAIAVPATFMLKEHDMLYRINSAECKAIICSSTGDTAQVCDNIEAQCPTLETKMLVNGAGGGKLSREEAASLGYGPALSGEDGVCRATAERDGWIDFNAGVLAAPEGFERRETTWDEPFLMYFSSGTSGEPKMIMHDHSLPLAHCFTAKWWQSVCSDDGLHFTIADTGWAKTAWGKIFGQWVMEAAVFTYDFDRFHADEILDLIPRYHITTLCCPPTMYRMMRQTDFDAHDLSCLTYCATAGEALNPDLFQFWKEHTGHTIHEGFGQTETSVIVGNWVGGPEPKPGSMGKPSQQFTVEIQRDDGSRCDTGETGEICIKLTPDLHGILKEYYKNPEEQAKSRRRGWYHTGDTAWVDEDGYFFYVGRNDDVIKSSGYRIGPFEIESVLLAHEAVRECAVTGVPDPVRGYAVKATVVLSKGFEGTDDLTKELQTWVKHKTAPYKYPRVIDYVDELPKTTSGKIRRVAIRIADEERAHLPVENDKIDGLT